MFEVIDRYEGHEELIGTFDTIKEAKKAIKGQIRDTDGECDCVIRRVSAKKGE